MAQEGPIQRKKNSTTPQSRPKDEEDKPKPPFVANKAWLGDVQKNNFRTLFNFAIPCIVLAYAGILAQGYSVKEFNGLVTNRYFLLGFKDLETLKRALVANLRDSAIWGLTYLYVRRWMNPEFRDKTATFVQDGYFGAFSTFTTTLAKQIITNFS